MAKLKKIRSKVLAIFGGTFDATIQNDIVSIGFGGVPVFILGIQSAGVLVNNAQGEEGHLQIAKRASMSRAVDDREVLQDIKHQAEVLTSGVYNTAFEASYMFPSGYGMQVGVDEKVYLHGNGTNGANFDIIAKLFYFVEDDNA